MKQFFATLYFLLVISTLASACSAVFVNQEQKFLGKNFDWHNDEGAIVLNKRGIKKVAYGLDKENVVGWTSRFGSITFNQVGKEFPYGGVNERGLAIEMLWYDQSYYEESGMPSVSELEWIQYNLDNYKTAAEVQFYLDSMNINPIHAKLHYIVADRGGRSFVVDFVNGKAVVSNTDDHYQVLTNSNYLGSLNYYQENKENIDFESRKSADRFCQLSSKASTQKRKTIQNMFDMLKESKEDEADYKTYWTIVYDLPNLTAYYKSYDNPKVKIINLNSLDLSMTSNTYAAEINSDLPTFKRFTPEWNMKLLSASLAKTNVKLNLEQANKHMLAPGKFEMDSEYSKNQKDLKVTFNVKKDKGLLFYTLMQGKENYEKFRSSVSAVTRANKNTIQRIHYSMPNGEYVLATIHDMNSNSKLDRFLGIPSEPTAFSNNGKGFFGPPKYDKVVFKLVDNNELLIDIN